MTLILKTIHYHKQEIIRLVGKENAKILFNAIKKDIPIMVYEENVKEPIDGNLYKSLKALGAKSVRNVFITKEWGQENIKGVYVAYIDIPAKKQIINT